MATKNNPGKYDCYAKAEPDEPMFILLARDKYAPSLVWLWAALKSLDNEQDSEKVEEARQCVLEMMGWQVDHGKQVSGTGQAVLAGVLELIKSANYAVKMDDVKNSPTKEEFVRRLLAETKFGET